MTARRRCTRGHFIPATAPTNACHCQVTPRRRPRPRTFTECDLLGQRATVHQLRTMTTLHPTGTYL